MKLDFNELERGFDTELEKSALFQGWGEKIFPGMAKINKGVDYLTNGNLMKDMGGMVMSALPIIGLMSGGGAPPAAGAGAIPNININIPGAGPKFMEGGPGVRTFGGASRIPKMAGLLDLNVLKTVLTARAANDAVDAVQGKNRIPDRPAQLPATDQREVELTTRYPEIKKILADPQSRAYLESLLTKDASYGT